MNEFLEQEEQVLKMIKTVFDPEIPVNIYDLGLIYKIDLSTPAVCNIDMTLTAPSCPAGEFLVEDIKQKVGSVDGIETVNVNIVFEPEWSKDMMSEEAKLELGML
ncbi:MAG: metal-sulfur cluster assembly factor [Paludibacteraceae bacterium]